MRHTPDRTHLQNPVTVYKCEGNLYSFRNGHTDAIVGEGILGVQERFITARTRAFVHYVSEIEGMRVPLLQETLKGLYEGILI